MSAIGKDFNGQQVNFKTVDDAGEKVPVFEVQGEALTALQSINASDDAIYSMIDTLNELVSRLGVLLSARAADGTLRISGTVAATTLSNLAAVGGYNSNATVQQQTNQLVQLANTANVG